MSKIYEYISENEDGVDEAMLSAKFNDLTKIDIAKELSVLLRGNQIEVLTIEGKMLYKSSLVKVDNYTTMIMMLIQHSGTTGVWLRDIKTKTNIPHNLVLKILKNLESARKIKSIKNIKNNRKMYILYDTKPDDNVSGGVWFSNNDVDLDFVNRLMDVIYKYCYKPEDASILTKLESLVKEDDLFEFILKNKLTEVELTMNDLGVLIDTLIYDGRMERYRVNGTSFLRSLKEDYLLY
ncbi:DNA-directed RNA polymerase III subunit RPC6 [Enteropsectra breve]|nr:DNA-directed RNA polymerase III subunit RPC6 [Enteropsectra breve]